MFWESQRTRRTQSKRRRGGPCVRKGARPARGPGGAWRASHAMLWFWEPEATRPGSGDAGDSGDTGAPLRGDGKAVVQSGVSRRPIGPIRPIGPTALCYGTSQTCRGCRGEWKFGSLDAWKFGFSAQRLFCRALAARSVFCFLWPWKVWPFGPARSVLRSPGRESALPLPGRGAAPHIPISQSANQPISGAATPPLRSHRRQRRRPGLQPPGLLQASKPPNFQTFPV